MLLELLVLPGRSQKFATMRVSACAKRLASHQMLTRNC